MRARNGLTFPETEKRLYEAGDRAPARLIRRQETLGPTPTPGGAAGRPQEAMDEWITRGFERLSARHVREWRAESLRLARGVLQRIHQMDLNGDGWADLLVCNSQNHRNARLWASIRIPCR